MAEHVSKIDRIISQNPDVSANPTRYIRVLSDEEGIESLKEEGFTEERAREILGLDDPYRGQIPPGWFDPDYNAFANATLPKLTKPAK